MTLLPNNIFPTLIENAEEEDVEDVTDDYDIENDDNTTDIQRDEHFQCEENQLLSQEQVRQIKRAAQRAYEKQSRYQEDIQLRTKRLILKLREATQKLVDNGWGWKDETYRNAFDRLNDSISCFSALPVTHIKVFTAVGNPPTLSEKIRIANIYKLLEPDDDASGAKRFETIAQLREAYGERFDEVMKEVQHLSNTVTKLSKIYEPSSYKSTLSVDLKRMDIVLALAEQYEGGRLQRRVWAEKMQSRNMRHFFDQDFFEAWYNPMLRDLDENLVRNIAGMEDKELPRLRGAIDNGIGLQIGSMLYFGETEPQHEKNFGEFVQDIVQCTFGDVKNESVILLNLFKKAMHEFQSAYTNLYKKELTAYLANFEFGSAFVEQNFAMVNVFLHRMNVETWRQDSTYSIWSLACDVGGALGLFLGASLLTVIELIYLCFQYGLCTPPCYSFSNWWTTKTHPVDKEVGRKKETKCDSDKKLTEVIVEGSKNATSPTISVRGPSPIKEVDAKGRSSSVKDVNEAISETLPDHLTIANGFPGGFPEKFARNIASIDYMDKESDSVCEPLLNAGSSEGQPISRSSSKQFRKEPGLGLSFDSGSSESMDKVTTLFRPKTERQTFV